MLADGPFTTENAMMTPTLKIRRHKIREAYWQRLDSLYGRS
jgi:long-chain acyl-CoA synthetase